MEALSGAVVAGHKGTVADRNYQSDYNPEIVRWVPDDAATILDVGCGAGGNAAFLARRGVVVDGVTLSGAEADQAGTWCRRVYLHDLEQGLPAEHGGPYDAIICSHVLEHICFPQQLLGDIRSRLRSGGRLVIAVPNLFYFRNRINLLMGRFEYEQGGIMDDTHFRWYTLPTLNRLLATQGFRVLHSYGAGNIPLGPIRKLAPSLCRNADLAACRAIPGLFGAQLLTVATV